MTDADSPVQLATVLNEMFAAPIIGALAAEGIEAHAVGGFTAGFLAEAPGSVQIMVKYSDLDSAQVVLERYNAQQDVDEPLSEEADGTE